MERRTYRVFFRAAEQAFGGGIEHANSASVVNDDNRIRRYQDDRRESLRVEEHRVFERVMVGGGVDLRNHLLRTKARFDALPLDRILGA